MFRVWTQNRHHITLWLSYGASFWVPWREGTHYNDVTMGTMTSQITSLMIVYSTVYSSRRLKKTSKLRVTGLCEGNSPVAQRASDTENVFIWWSHHDGRKVPQEFGSALYIECHYKTFFYAVHSLLQCHMWYHVPLVYTWTQQDII